EKRRVELAMALAQKPRVLLLDEPLAGLSNAERATVKQLIAAIPRENSVIMIEHDMNTALDLAETVTLLNYGRVIVDGARDAVVEDPRTREVYLGVLCASTDGRAGFLWRRPYPAWRQLCPATRQGAGVAGPQRLGQDNLHFDDHRTAQAQRRRDQVVRGGNRRPQPRTHLASRHRPGAAGPAHLSIA